VEGCILGEFQLGKKVVGIEQDLESSGSNLEIYSLSDRESM
jgi:hypothetical protein